MINGNSLTEKSVVLLEIIYRDYVSTILKDIEAEN